MFYWKMSFGISGQWQIDELPPILKKHYVMVPKDDVINGVPEPHLMGFGIPKPEIIEAISNHFNQYLHLKMPFGLKSYVWPSGERIPVRCRSDDAINHFYCNL